MKANRRGRWEQAHDGKQAGNRRWNGEAAAEGLANDGAGEFDRSTGSVLDP